MQDKLIIAYSYTNCYFNIVKVNLRCLRRVLFNKVFMEIITEEILII